MATYMNLSKAEGALSPSQKRGIKEKWAEYQEASKQRKLNNRKGRNLLRKELRTLQTTENVEDYISLKKFTIDSYKELYPDEDWTDPYADPTNGISDYEDLESDESDTE
jgi:hypothetical protein